ncbi:hypothetical protein LTR66_009394 [Elasticomyces elasticus]|nr:hypothetical protein LTR66_009394 [Elasticomyces elasticus]
MEAIKNSVKDMGNFRPFYHETVPITIRVAQAVGLTASAFLCGSTIAATTVTVPSLLEAPAPLLAKQWRKMYDLIGGVSPAVSAVCGLTFAGLAYREPMATPSFNLYVAASVLLLPGTLAYTFLTTKPTTDKLLEKTTSLSKASITDTAAESGVAQEDTVHALVDKWASLNLLKGVMYGVGALLAAWATIGEIDVRPFDLDSIGFKTGANRVS